MEKSPKQASLERKLLKMVDEKKGKLLQFIFDDPEIAAIQNYANTVSIRRLGFNDHGPVHVRVAMMNALSMLNLLHKRDVKTNLVEEEIGTRDDSTVAVILATFFHDFGMSVGRANHELMSIILAQEFIMKALMNYYDDRAFANVMRTVITEGIIGHMGHQKIHSLEAGLVLIADGCDMASGRARIPTKLKKEPTVGDIHRYSASSITNVTIEEGDKKPIRIIISMADTAGFFQVEEVLMPKINASPVKPYIELMAEFGEESLQYL